MIFPKKIVFLLGMLKSYKYRLLPTEEQKIILAQGFGACRFIYNLGLESKIAAWTSAKKNVSCFDLMKQLTELKRSGLADWLNDVCAQSLESALTNLDNAYTKFFKGGGFPKFKKRSNRQSMVFRRETKIKDGRIYFQKYHWFDFVQHRPIPEGAEIRSATVSKTPSGAYFVSVLVNTHQPLPEKKAINPETAVGIDVGLKTFATLSDGQQFENPKFLQEQLKRLRVEQRTLSRRYVKGIKISEQSKGWHKQRLVVAKLQEKIANKRSDFLHKVSDSITKNFDSICVEDLNVKGMMKNDKLAKAIGDVSWAEFYRLLEYKAEWRGKNILKIGRFDPSSKICSACGAINKELKLSDREWECKCGAHHDRDINAAKNIKNFGLNAKPSTAKVSH